MTAVNLKTGASLYGRILAQTAVTLEQNLVTIQDVLVDQNFLPQCD